MVKLESVLDAGFKEFGQVLEGYGLERMLEVLEKTPFPGDGIVYVPSDAKLEATDTFEELRLRYYGGMPIQAGYCNGHGVKLNGLEYHRDSEVNIAGADVILLLARQADIDREHFTLDTSRARAFLLPAGKAVELFATTLHYAPCSAGPGGFRVAVVLPRGTNQAKPGVTPRNPEDKTLAAANKWLLIHPEAYQEGLHAGLTGENIDVTPLWRT